MVQRGLKAVGTFAYQAHRRDRKHYLAYVAPTLHRVARALPGEERWRPLARLLASLRAQEARSEGLS